MKIEIEVIIEFLFFCNCVICKLFNVEFFLFFLEIVEC